MSALIDSPWRELALTIQDEVETEVEAGNDIIDQLNPSSLEESGVDDPKKSESDVNLNSDNEVDPAQNDHSWLRRFVSDHCPILYSVSVYNFYLGFSLQLE